MDDFRCNTLILGSDSETTRQLIQILSNYQGIHLIPSGNDTKANLETILKEKVNLVFVDLSYIRTERFELIRSLNHYHLHPAIVVISTNQDYAYLSIKYGVFDYLLKPLDTQEVEETILKYFDYHNNRIYQNRLDTLMKLLVPKKKVRFSTHAGSVFIETDEILYIEAEGNYSFLFYNGKESALVTQSLSHIQNLLPANQFQRVNRSIIINKTFLKEIRRREKTCTLSKDHETYTFSITPRYLREMQEG